jgi:hypothetical protein
MGQSTQHQADHCGLEEGFARRVAPLVVLAQAATLPKPAERALDHPAAGQAPRNSGGLRPSQAMTAPVGVQTPRGFGGCPTLAPLQAWVGGRVVPNSVTRCQAWQAENMVGRSQPLPWSPDSGRLPLFSRYAGMSLSVRADNPAVRLYERVGFRKVVGTESVNRVGTTSYTMRLSLR